MAIQLESLAGVPSWATQLKIQTMWQFKLALVFIPVMLYGLLIIGCRFPVNERVAAGVSYRNMLKEAGLLSILVALSLIVIEVTRVLVGLGLIFQGPEYD